MDQASYVKGWNAGSRVASEAAAAAIERLRAALQPFVNIDPIDEAEVEYLISCHGAIAAARTALRSIEQPVKEGS